MKVFLSHSSDDKYNYVEHIAKALGRDVAIYDQISFEAAKKLYKKF